MSESDYEYLDRLYEQIDELQSQVVSLHKALDKACDSLAEICLEDGVCSPIYCPSKDGVYQFCGFACENASSWKEWCMKDD
jgi:hypothetical protein